MKLADFDSPKMRRDALNRVVKTLESEVDEMFKRVSERAGDISFDEDVTAIKEEVSKKIRVRNKSGLADLLERFAVSLAAVNGLINGLMQKCALERERAGYWERKAISKKEGK